MVTHLTARRLAGALLVCQLGCNALFGLDDLVVVGGSGGTGAGTGAGPAGGAGGAPDTDCGVPACSGNGDCDSGVCSCDTGWAGDACDACAVGYAGTDCGACDDGFQDADDNGTCMPACQATTCSDHGVCDDSSGELVCICQVDFSGDDCSVACASGTAGTGCEFGIVYGLDIPTTADWLVPADVLYDIDNSANVGSFDRVAYRLILDDEEVWVEMMAFTDQADRLGVPVDWIWDVPVADVLVRSTSPNQPNIVRPATGSVELWSECYTEGTNGIFDYDDTISVGGDCYGSLQVHVSMATVLAVNSWANAGNAEVGIGESPGPNPDWTFTNNAGAFTVKRLEVYARE